MAPRERSGLSLRWEFVPGIEGTDRAVYWRWRAFTQTGVLFSESGKIEPSDSTQAMLIMGSSFAEVTITDVEAFARMRAGKTTRIGPLRNIQGRTVTTDGLMGYELTARTNDAQSGKDLDMYQLILADKTTYYLAQGFVTPQRAPVILPQFRLITGSFRRVRPTR